jgi:predicted permease
MSHLGHDIRFAIRLLRRSPGFTAIVTLTLALGIGATTAIFSVVHAALLKPLPFKDPQGIVNPLNGTNVADATGLSYPQLRRWREYQVFDALAGYFSWGASIAGAAGGADEAEYLQGIRTSASLFTILGVQPIVGRLFTEAEESFPSDRVVLISESFWRRAFNADPNIPGRRIVLNDAPFTIVGVLPGWFRRVRPNDPGWDLFGPLRLTEASAPASLRFMRTVARLKPEQSLAVAQEQLQAAALREAPDANLPPPRVVVLPLRERIVSDSRAVLLGLFGAVAFLLLITCANLANLLLARAIGRRREIAVRLAVGADRRRIVSQLLTESLMLSAAGGAGGMLIAWVVVRAAGSLPALAAAGVYDLTLSWPVLLFSVLLTLVIGVLFGMAPALRAGRAPMTADLRDGTRVAAGRDRLRQGLVVGEVALTLMLLAGAGLLGRSLVKLLEVDKGFSGSSVITFRLSTTAARYPTAADDRRFFESVMDRVSALPGVEAVGLTSEFPLADSDTNGGVLIDGRTFAPGERPMAQKRIVSPGYFAAMGIPIRRGRDFLRTDTATAPPVIVISEAFAKQWFAGEEPIGKRIAFNWDMDGFQTIIGVVPDLKHNGLDDPPTPAIYVSFAQRADSSFNVAIKTAVPPESLMPAIRAELKAIDPTRPIRDVRTMEALVTASVGARRLSLDLVGAFAAIGLLLAATGIFGVVNHTAQQRSREFGIRLALGAERRSVIGLVMRQALGLAVVGLAIGVAGVIALGGIIRAQLFGVEPSDPLTLAAVCAALLATALLAGYHPARRAVRTNPANVLREG